MLEYDTILTLIRGLNHINALELLVFVKDKNLVEELDELRRKAMKKPDVNEVSVGADGEISTQEIIDGQKYFRWVCSKEDPNKEYKKYNILEIAVHIWRVIKQYFFLLPENERVDWLKSFFCVQNSDLYYRMCRG